MSGWLLMATLAAIFLGLFVLVFIVASSPLMDVGRRRRLAQLGWFGDKRDQATDSDARAIPALATTVFSWADRTVTSRSDVDRMAVQLERAGMALRPHEWMMIRVGVVIAGAIGGAFLLPWFLGIPLGLLLGWLAPELYRIFRAKRRISRFADQLPDALQLIVGSLQTGFSVAQSLDALVKESTAPVSTEFGRVLAETQLGADIADALERAAERTKNEDLACVVMAIRIQQEVGGSLAEVLQTTVHTMRERARLRGQVRALSAEGRLSAWILVGLPIVIGFYMFLFRRDYVSALYTEPLGIAMLVYAVFMMAVGTFWMNRLVKVEV